MAPGFFAGNTPCRKEGIHPTIHQNLVTETDMQKWVSSRGRIAIDVPLFLNHEPENHIIEDDDASTTLFSLDVGYFL